MTTVLAFLSNLKLSLGQILTGLGALTIGFLVLALRLQGGRLHKAQVSLLEAQYGQASLQQGKRVDAARAKYEKAKAAFEETK